jgi:hypothetical protein
MAGACIAAMADSAVASRIGNEGRQCARATPRCS